MNALIWICLAWFSPPQRGAFKPFFESGLKKFENGRYQEALDDFQEAYRLDKKARTYLAEGVFPEHYLPRYRVALCYEKLEDPFQAREWALKSREALEGGVIRRKPRIKAAYHRDIDRILKTADDLLAARKQRYDAELKTAESLLAQNKFEEAKAAFEALQRLDSERAEAAAGLGQIELARDNYLKGKVLDLKTALLDGDFAGARAQLAQIERVDAGYAELDLLRGQIERSEARAAQPAEPEPAVAEPEPTVAEPATAGSGTADGDRDDRPVAAPPEQPDVAPTALETANDRAEAGPRETNPVSPAASQDDAAAKQALRAAMLATLKPYRRGDAEMALSALESIDPEAAGKYGSYHWLKGVYLLTLHRQAATPEPEWERQAAESIRETARLLPEFTPDRDLYPDFIIDFFAKTTRK